MTATRDGLPEVIAAMDEAGSLELVRRRLAAGDDPLDVIAACRRGVELVGRRYEEGTYYISALIMAGEILREATELIAPYLARRASGSRAGTVVMATVRGDIHDVGKGIAATLLETHGFEIVDLGADVPVEDVVEAVVTRRPELVGLSCLLTTVYESLRETVAAVRARLGDATPPIVIGGSTLSQAVCEVVGADGWCNDAADGARLIRSLVDARRA